MQGLTRNSVPHITNAIQDWIEKVARIPVDESGAEPDVCVIELGGTVGDIESAPFVHAVSQLHRRAGKNNFIQILVAYVPIVGEQKTKPTQRAVSDSRSAGLNPDLVLLVLPFPSPAGLTGPPQIACRCEQPLEEATISKIANMCQVEKQQVIAVHNVSTTYHVPLLLDNQKLLDTLSPLLDIPAMPRLPARIEQGSRMWKEWVSLARSQDHALETVTVALVGKYTSLHDAYISVSKALEHSAMYCRKKLELVWVDSSHLEDETQRDSPADFHKAWHAVCTAKASEFIDLLLIYSLLTNGVSQSWCREALVSVEQRE